MYNKAMKAYERTSISFPARLLCLAFALLLCMGLSVQAQASGMGTLKIKLFKSGKADAFLIRTGSHAVLLDTAEVDDAEDILEYMAEKGVDKLDLMILTHFDKGHAGGAPEILRTVPVDRVLMPDYEKSSPTRDALREALAMSQAEQVYLKEDTAFTLDSVAFEIITARQDDYAEDEDNDFSLVTRLTHGDNRLLFAADIMSERIDELLQSGIDLNSDFLQVPDHGRNRDRTEAFLHAVQPRWAVITCSQKNPPAGAVLDILQRIGARIYLTMDGDIALQSDGQAITFKQ